MQDELNRYTTESLEKKVNINERELTSRNSGSGIRTHVTCPMKAGWHLSRPSRYISKTDIKIDFTLTS